MYGPEPDSPKHTGALKKAAQKAARKARLRRNLQFDAMLGAHAPSAEGRDHAEAIQDLLDESHGNRMRPWEPVPIAVPPVRVTESRCNNCGHDRSYHSNDGPCTVGTGAMSGSAAMCQCVSFAIPFDLTQFELLAPSLVSKVKTGSTELRPVRVSWDSKPQCWHSSDFHTLSIAGTTLHATTNQAGVIQMLAEAAASGIPDVSKRELEKKAGVPRGRLWDSFRASDGPEIRKQLIITARKGFYRLRSPHSDPQG